MRLGGRVEESRHTRNLQRTGENGQSYAVTLLLRLFGTGTSALYVSRYSTFL